MRYEDFDDYEYSRSASRRGGGSEAPRSSERSTYRDYDREYDRGYDREYGYERREYQDYDRSSGPGGSYGASYGRDYDYDRAYQDYDRYRGEPVRNDRFDDFDRYNWERTAPNWDRKTSTGARKRRPSSDRSSGSRSSSASRERRDRERSRDRDRDRDRRDTRGTRDSRGGGRPSSSRSGSQSRSRSYDDARRRNDRSRRSHERDRKRGMGRFLPAIIALIVLVVAALVIKTLWGSLSGSDYKISFTSDTIVVDETVEATITGIPDGASPTVNWISGDTSVVAITESEGASCTLTAKSEGTATIAATITPEDGSKDVSISGTLTVVKTAPGVLGITLAVESATVYSGENYTISATVNMEDGYSPAKISWTSNDASVARVSDEGVVSARDVGTAIITATAGEKTAEFVVTVVENPNGTPPDDSQLTAQAPEGSENITGVSSADGASGEADTSGGGTDSAANSDSGGNSDAAEAGSNGEAGTAGDTGEATDNGGADNAQVSGEITGVKPAE